METALCLLAGVVLIAASSSLYPSVLNFAHKLPYWGKVPDVLSHVLVAYGIFFLGIAFLSYLLSLRGTSLVSTVANRSRQALTELRQALSSSIRDGLASRQDVAWLLAACAVGLAIRGFFLAQPMRHDESRTFLDFVNQGPFHLFYYPSPNNHVLHTLLVKLSTLLWGAHPVSIRFPAFLFGIASVPLTFCLCRKLLRERSGILASTAMAVAPYMVLYSTNARGYSLLVFLTLALAFMGVHVAEKPSLPGWALLSLIAALGMMTMPTMVFAIAGLYLWLVCLLLLNRKTFAAILREFAIPCTIMTFAFTLILYTPTIVASGGVGSFVASPAMKERSLPWNDFLNRVHHHVPAIFRYFSRDIPHSVLLMGMILLIAGVLGAARRRDWPLLLLLPSMLLGAAVVFLIKHRIPPARIWIYLIPFGFVLMDSGFTYLREKLPRLQFLLPLLLVALGGLYAVSLMSRSAKLPIPEAPFMVKYLKPLLRSNDVVHFKRPVEEPMRFYLWYYGVPAEKGAANTGVRKEFFIVKKGRYTVSDMTKKPVIKLLDFDNAVLYQLLPTETIPTKKAMDRPKKGIVPH